LQLISLDDSNIYGMSGELDLLGEC